MGQHWYYQHNGQQHGPVTGAELKQLATAGKLNAADKVKRDGMADWLSASQVKGLFPDIHDKVQQKADAVGKAAGTVSKVAKAAGKVSDAVSDVAEAGGKVQKAVTKVAGIAAGGSTFAGSIGDFLRPLGPINLVIFAAALLSGGVLFVLAKKKLAVKVKFRLQTGAVASLAVAVIFGLWTGMGAVAGKGDKGFLATNIKPIEQLQASVVPMREPARTEQQPIRAEDAWQPLFNGTDLTGWQDGPNQSQTWKVREGVLVSSGPPGLLISTRGDFANFHLRAEVKINDGGNSGVFFRVPPTAGFTDGYEADINSTHKNPARTGTLRRKGDVAVIVKEMLVPPGQWFTYEVIAEGSHITLKVNGKTTADFNDPDPVASTGHIALQQHNPETSVEFRKIEVKELPPPLQVTLPPSLQPAPVETLPKGWVALSDTKEQVQKHWKQGDNRGSFFYDAPSKTIKIKSLGYLGEFRYQGSWLEFQVIVNAAQLSTYGDKVRRRFNLLINGTTTLKLDPAVVEGKGPVRIAVKYDPKEHTIVGLVNGKVVEQATVTGASWEKEMKFGIDTAGTSGESIVSLYDARVLTGESKADEN